MLGKYFRVAVVSGPGPFVNPISTTPKLLFDGVDGLTGAGGSAIATWADQGSLGKNLTSAGALQPTVGTLNGLACAVFSGANNMNTAAYSPDLSQPNTIFCLLQTTNTAAQQDFLDGETTARNLMFLAVTTNNTGIFAGSVVSSTTAINGAAGVLSTGIFNGASSKLYLNGGAAAASSNANTQPMSKLWIGSNYTAGNKLTGKIQFVAIFNAALSTADLTTFGQYVGTRYGITVSTYT